MAFPTHVDAPKARAPLKVTIEPGDTIALGVRVDADGELDIYAYPRRTLRA